MYVKHLYVDFYGALRRYIMSMFALRANVFIGRGLRPLPRPEGADSRDSLGFTCDVLCILEKYYFIVELQ